MRINGVNVPGVEIKGPVTGRFSEVITSDALSFIADLHRKFESIRQGLLYQREYVQHQINNGILPNFLEETRVVRESKEWQVAPIPPDLQKRRVEITGPASSTKMVINALNSGADFYMADAEDSETPTWFNIISGQLNLKDAVRRRITLKTDKKEYTLNDKTATLGFRPRGWHLNEEHVLVDGKPVSASLFDFGMYFYHNARELVEKGSTPAFYLPKMESYKESELWNEVFKYSQDKFSIPQGTIRATQLIETLHAAFQMHEMLYALKEHSSGLNFGRWDYLYSFLKTLRAHPQFILPFKHELTMDKHFLKSVAELIVQTCHMRGVHAMGGMSALIPIKDNPEANAKAIAGVRADKVREAQQGFDGAWVAHPGLVQLVMEVFDEVLQGKPNQIDKKREDVNVTQADILSSPTVLNNPPIVVNAIQEEHVRANIKDAVEYNEPWLRGIGCVPLRNRMEDLATAHISVSQLDQWTEHKVKLADGRKLDIALMNQLIKDEMREIEQSMSPEDFAHSKFALSRQVLEQILNSRQPVPFITDVTYPHVVTTEGDTPIETKEQLIKRLEDDWANNPRWKGIIRPYSAEDVYRLGGASRPKISDAKAGATKLWKLINREEGVRVLSAITGNQAIQEVRAGLEAIYLSGWQVAADNNDALEMYPDQSLYASHSMPILLKRINNALHQAERIHIMKGDHSIDWMVPLVADGESGFGGPLNVFELMRFMIRGGAAGVHFEDQLASAKKCGHMGGKVLVPTSEFITKLVAARFAADIMGADTILIARTDAESGSLLTSDVDDRDKPFIDYSKGVTSEGFFHVKASIEQAIARGLAYAPYADMIWCETSTPDLEEARKFAEGIHAKYPGKLLAYNCSPSFNWVLNFMMKEIEAYSVRGFALDAKVKEAIKNIAQVIIKEGSSANFESYEHKDKVVENYVRSMGKEIKNEPGAIDHLIASTNLKIENFQNELAKMGYRFQFVTLSGFHVLNLATFLLAEDYKNRGMLAYSSLQKQEFEAAERGFEAVKHQDFVGAGYFDEISKIVSGGGASTLALKGSTEEAQFHK